LWKFWYNPQGGQEYGFEGGQLNAEWFAGRLRELRENAGWTQQQLAEKAGLTRDGVAQLETGRRKPGWDTVVAICKALGVTCDAFLQAPTTSPPAGPGRPRKATEGDADQESAAQGSESLHGKRRTRKGKGRGGKGKAK
jgi:transcriptional regulator with XRE-family HTH domain